MGLLNNIVTNLDRSKRRNAIVIRAKNRILSMMSIKQLMELHNEYIKPKENSEPQTTAGMVLTAVISPALDRQGYIDELRKGLTLDQLKDLAQKHHINIKTIIADYETDINKM